MSAVIESLAKHLQERVNKAEPEVERLRKRLEEVERERDAALDLLRRADAVVVWEQHTSRLGSGFQAEVETALGIGAPSQTHHQHND